MAAIPVVVNVTEDKDSGTFTATVHIKNGGTILAKRQVQAATKQEFKDKIRPRLQAFLEEQARRQQLVDAANQALDELITELGF